MFDEKVRCPTRIACPYFILQYFNLNENLMFKDCLRKIHNSLIILEEIDTKNDEEVNFFKKVTFNNGRFLLCGT